MKRVSVFPTVPPSDDRPLLVKWMPFLALIQAGRMLLALLLGLQVVEIDGLNVAPMDLPATGFTALAALAVAATFWWEKLWSRHLLLACFTVSAVRAGLLSGSLYEIFPAGLTVIVFAAWYF